MRASQSPVILGESPGRNQGFPHGAHPLRTMGTVSMFFLEPSQVLAAPLLPSPHTSQFSCVAITVSKGNTNVMHSALSECDTTLQNVLIKTGVIYTQRETFQKVMLEAEVFSRGQVISRSALPSDPGRVEVTGTLSAGGPLGYLSTLVKVT